MGFGVGVGVGVRGRVLALPRVPNPEYTPARLATPDSIAPASAGARTALKAG